jgi:Lsr2
MAQRAQVIFTDDLDGSEAARTATFALQGVACEVDLSKKNADKLAKLLEPYIAAARKPSTRPATRSANRSRQPGPAPADVRAWAKSEGIDVKDKGRVPAELINKFQAATLDQSPAAIHA